MKLLPNSLVPTLFSLLAAALLAALVACGQDTTPTEIVPPTATPAPTAESIGPTPRPSPTPMAMLPTQTPAPSPTPTAAPPTAVPSALASQVYATLVELTEQYSPRESATDQELEAALHLRTRLNDLGYETSIQDFTVNLLTADVELHSTTGDSSDAPRVIPISMSAHGSATGVFANAGHASENDIPSEGLEGRIALIERGAITGVITFEEKVDRVADAGAVGAVIFNDREGLFRGTFTRESEIPAVAVSQADGNRLLELIEQGELEATVQVGAADSPSRNIIADKPGTTGDGGTVIIGAHYDTVSDTEGASDNGSGVATVLTLAEHIADRDYPFDVRIIFFGSEEVGLLGSQHYVANMSDEEVGDTVTVLNFDALGSGSTLQASGDPDLVAAATESGKGFGLDLGRFSEEAWASLGGASDHGPFRLVGIPVFFLISDDLSRINSPADELRHVNPHLLGIATEIGIHLLDRLAEQN